jgi:hypothetical protein
MREREFPGNNFLRTPRRTPGSTPQREKGRPNLMDRPLVSCSLLNSLTRSSNFPTPRRADLWRVAGIERHCIIGVVSNCN